MARRSSKGDIGTSLLALYEPAAFVSVPEFGDQVFAWLNARLPLDSGALGTMFYGRNGVGYQAFRLHRQPIDKVLSYPEIAHLDVAAAAMVRNVGRASLFSVPRDLVSGPSTHPMRSYAQRFGVAQSLTFCTRQGHAGDAFALWRGSNRKPFLPGEGRLAEALAPHIFLALRLNAGRLLAPGVADDSGECIVVADPAGFMIACDPKTVDWLAAEWPQWEPPLLPRPLLAAILASSERTHRGRTLRARWSLEGSVLVVKVTRLDAVPMLTPAQARVAHRLTGAGGYKQIAHDLHISPATVRNHAHAVYARLGVRSRSELTAMWVEGRISL